MKVIPVAEAKARVSEIANVLAEGGLACFPLLGTYRIVADVNSVDAVTRLVQSKRRAKNHPALVAVAGTHLLAPEEGAAAIGNIYTRRDRRGRGLGRAVTSAVLADLAGIETVGLNVRADFRHLTDADWVKIREVNLDGVVRVARDGFALLKASGRGSLINVASIMAHRGLRQLTAYSATKGAVTALTRGLAVEYAPFGIRVNALAPGFIETALTARVLRIEAFSKALLEQTPLRRFGTSEDVAYAALYFASDESAFITGAELAVDGGMQARL